MPKKQNGFGKVDSLAFKEFNRIDRGKGKGAAGSYPSNRRYGSSVQRSVVEKWNLDSDWVKWRKGYEYYNRAAWYPLESYIPVTQEYVQSSINSVLYQGTNTPIDVTFTGNKFSTTNSDSNNHYVVKRETTSQLDIGYIDEVRNNIYEYPRNKANREIWCKGVPGTDAIALTRMIGERLTDGETEATLDYFLGDDEKPVLHIGKSFQDLTTIKVTIPISSIAMNTAMNFDVSASYKELEGQLVYIPEFYTQKNLTSVTETEWIDGIEYFGVRLKDTQTAVAMSVLYKEDEALPPSLYDIATLPKILETSNCDYTIEGTYLYNKDLYQKFYGKQYITADLIENRIQTVSYSVMPFEILGVSVEGSNIVITSVPAITTLELYGNITTESILVFADYSFTKSTMEYNQETGELWKVIDTDVDPWMDEVFTSGNPIRPATTYACSCPNHSHSILSAPQATEDEGQRKINRQRRYPLPTVLSQDTFSAIGKNQAAGKIESWESREHQMSFKMCKHSIASMFIDDVKIKEPNKYPTVEARVQFEEKLDKEMNEVGEKFAASYRRGGITTLEVIFALAQGLNLDDTELAYVILKSNF